jgi:hypothetical protein
MSSRDHNQDLANTIMDIWGRRGYAVNVEVVPLRATSQGEGETVIEHSGYTLKSDMINGWPRDLFERRCNDARAGMVLI